MSTLSLPSVFLSHWQHEEVGLEQHETRLPAGGESPEPQPGPAGQSLLRTPDLGPAEEPVWGPVAGALGEGDVGRLLHPHVGQTQRSRPHH